ncbi:TonB-dependent receptor [uncultured Sphingosinicella sp.]|uniref:TonB-dependent receptor n=1 Tax=uncultured Sphingosinicella sp. TaxID=478748 RepID=UPI0030DB668D|tara:strand:- start:38163 stop:40475 length:2313 start_codon:yes stop_codon:yes gene_type:complete
MKITAHYYLRIARRPLAGLLAVGIGGFALSVPVRAQEATASEVSTDQLQEIVVTANKRSENLQKVPIAISAVTAEQLANSGINSTAEIAQVVPGLVIQNSMNGTQAHLRGVGTTAIPAGTENSIATYIDGVYILSLSGAMMQLNSIEQVEVLKGPQGTLFGRNATGGVINVRTRDPDQEFGGSGEIRYGNYDTVSGQLYLTGGLSTNLAMDVAGYFSIQGDGWGKNLFNGRDANKMNEYAGRTKVLFTPGDRDEFRFAMDYSRSKGSTYNSFSPVGGRPTQYGPGATTAADRPDLAGAVESGALAPIAVVGDPYIFQGGFYDIDLYSHPRFLFKHGGASLQWDHDFDAIRLTSITAYRKATKDQYWSSQPVPAFVASAGWYQKESQFSQELQLGSDQSSVVQWVAGLYYLKGKASYDPFIIEGTSLLPLQQLRFLAFTEVESGAAFGQATVPLGENTNLTGGLRYTIEKRSITGQTEADFIPALELPTAISGVTDADKTFRKLTWRLALDHQLASNLLVYASYNRGFKSGIYNTIPPGGPGAQPVNPEVLDAYEVGIKTDLLDRHLRVNVAGFYYDYSDLQVTVFDNVAAVIQNGAKAEIYGLDLDVVARIDDHLNLSAGLNWTHSKFKSYPNAIFLVPQPVSAGGGNAPVSGSARGNELPYAPDLSISASVDYSVPVGDGEARFNLNYSYNDGWFAGPDNILRQPSYHLMNGQINYTLPGGAVTVGAWAKNIFKEKYYVFLSAGNNPGGYDEGLVGAPRTYGVSLGYKF